MWDDIFCNALYELYFTQITYCKEMGPPPLIIIAQQGHHVTHAICKEFRNSVTKKLIYGFARCVTRTVIFYFVNHLCNVCFQTRLRKSINNERQL